MRRQDFAAQVDDRRLGQEQEAGVVGDQTQAPPPLLVGPTDPVLALFEVARWRAKEQQSQPLAFGVGGDVVKPFAHGFDRAQVMVLVEQAIQLLELRLFHQTDPY